ncbi:hypothetical protein [Pseudomonas anguilliseptica]|uniref:hypothetical protein n=1 Tax=Pseudomonas anguilliseptica TaxID=53406 RepID=UPI000B844FE1|nr:hypothetical protein [Pseudomonas anguilliseptica]
MIDWIKLQISNFLDWLMELLGWYPKKLYSDFLAEIADFISDQVPPEFLDQAVSLLAQWTGPFGYFLQLIQFNWGIQLVISAITTRWVWSKIPFIGR